MIDEQFLGRVYKSSLGWSGLVLSYLLMAKLIPAAAGFGIGVAVALGVLHSIERVVLTVVVPGKQMSAKTKMAVFGISKYFILGIVVALVVKAGWISLPAFACGIGVPATIIFLKVLAIFFHELEFHPFWGNEFEPQRVSARKIR